MTNENTFENIHRFLAGEMSEEEKKAFGIKIKKDDSLKNKWKMEKNILHALELAGDTELKNTISAVHNDLKNKKFFESQTTKKEAIIVDMNKRRRANRMLYALAASVALMLAAWLVFNNNTPVINANAVYANYYKTEKTITTDLLNNIGQIGAVGQPETREEKLALALDQYNNGAFENAKKMFLELNTEFPKDRLIAFYAGLSQMETGNFNAAIDLFKTTNNNNFEHADAAQWYLGLSYLKTNQTKEAINLFGKVATNSSSVYQNNAKEILKKATSN